MFTLGPVEVSANPIVLNPQVENASAQPIIGVLVFNASTETFKVSFQGTSDWLHGYSIATLMASGNNVPTITLTPQDATGAGNVYATVYQQGDPMPSNVPTTINATTINLGSDSQVSLAAGTTVDLASGTTVDVASIAGSVDVTGSTVDLASGATVNLASGTSVDVSGTVDLASGTTVDVSSISGDVTVTGTVDLASGTTVDVGTISGTTTITGTVDLASGTSVDIGTVSGAVSLAAGTASIGTVALASGSTVTLDASTATIGTVDVNGPVALASGTSVAISGTPTVNATGSTVGLASGTTVDASGSTVSLASGTTVDLASGTSVEISSGTVTLAAGTASIGTVDVNGPVALASNTAVSISGTATVDATGSTVGLAAGTESIGTVGLASGTTVDVGTISGTVELAAGTAVIGTVDLASGSTVALEASTATIGTVDLASGSTVELAAGTAVIGTVDLASGASVDITSGTVDIGTVSGNVGVVNGSGNALLARTLPVGADVEYGYGYQSMVLSGGSGNFGFTPPAVGAASQLIVYYVIIEDENSSGTLTGNISLVSDSAYVVSGGGPYDINLSGGTTDYLGAYPFYVVVDSTTIPTFTIAMDNITDSTGSVNGEIYVQSVVWGETSTTAYSNPSLTGALTSTFTANQAAAPFTLTASGGGADSLAICAIPSAQSGTQSSGIIATDGGSFVWDIWYQYFTNGSVDVTFTGGDVNGTTLTQNGLFIPQ